MPASADAVAPVTCNRAATNNIAVFVVVVLILDCVGQTLQLWRHRRILSLHREFRD